MDAVVRNLPATQFHWIYNLYNINEINEINEINVLFIMYNMILIKIIIKRKPIRLVIIIIIIINI